MAHLGLQYLKKYKGLVFRVWGLRVWDRVLPFGVRV